MTQKSQPKGAYTIREASTSKRMVTPKSYEDKSGKDARTSRENPVENEEGGVGANCFPILFLFFQ